jgi:YjbE family integral membrane protein
LPEFLNGDFFVGLFFVLVTNLILSGDNAVVIAMAARRLEGTQRRQAIIWGAAGAVALRLIFAAVVTYLLYIPFLQVVGGLLLVWIAWKLVHDDEGDEAEDRVQAGESAWDAIRIIIIADAVMSLDNVIALVQAARIDGEVSFLLLGIGLATTIPLVIFGAALLTSLLDRFPALVYLGAGLLVYLAVEMFFGDVALHEYLEPYESFELPLAVAAATGFIAIAWAWAKRKDKADRVKKDIEKSREELEK